MKNRHLIPFLFGTLLTLCSFSINVHADPVFVQPFAGLAVVCNRMASGTQNLFSLTCLTAPSLATWL